MTSCVLEMDMVFDTGAHRTIIAEDLFLAEYRQYLKLPAHSPYRSTSGLVVQVDASIAIRTVSIH